MYQVTNLKSPCVNQDSQSIFCSIIHGSHSIIVFHMPSHTVNENDSSTVASNHVFHGQLRDIGSRYKMVDGYLPAEFLPTDFYPREYLLTSHFPMILYSGSLPTRLIFTRAYLSTAG